MTGPSRLLARLARLRPATTHRVTVERELAIPMADGAVLLADRYTPAIAGADELPILLSRTPYGRRLEGLLGRVYAERGYQVVIVSCRGTFGSTGGWDPFWNEQADGRAVLSWLADQPWFSGVVGTIGASYLGLTQWSVASDPPPFVKAMAPGVTTANFAEFIYPGGSFALESMLVWSYGLHHQELPPRKRWPALRRFKNVLPVAALTLPLSESDAALLGRRVGYVQDWLANDDPTGPFWSRIDFRRAVERVPPSSLVAGWYDIFVRSQVADYEALRAAGRPAQLTIGPWHHGSPGGAATLIRETLGWMDSHLAGRPSSRDDGDRVRLFVMGARRWISYPEWPPPAVVTIWHLQPGGRLGTALPPPSPPDAYRYDPADPTPIVGGTSLYRPHSGAKDNRPVEARPDVLTYTTDALSDDLTVVGSVRAELHVRSSVDYTDFFVRLCDVAPDGRSLNLCDGIVRLTPGAIERAADGSFPVRVELAPTANTFRAGHRVRLQVSSGASPLYAHNTGSGEPLAKAATLVAADQEVLHDPEHPSSVSLPVLAEPVRPQALAVATATVRHALARKTTRPSRWSWRVSAGERHGACS